MRRFTAAAIAIANTMGMLAVAGGPLYAEDYPVRPILFYVGSSAKVFDQALTLNKNFDFYGNASRTALGKT